MSWKKAQPSKNSKRRSLLENEHVTLDAYQKMEYDELKKSLWHAFDVLDTTSHSKKTRTSQVPKTKLRVLTNNLGHVLGVEQAETIWDKVSEDNIDFDRFITVLSTNLLVGLHKDPNIATLRAEIDNLCWILCEKSYRERRNSNSSQDGSKDLEIEESKERETNTVKDTFSATDRFKLWKIFNFLVERANDGSLLFPLRIDVEETERIASEICQAVGLPVPKMNSSLRRGSIDQTGSVTFLLDFSDYVQLIAQKISSDEDNIIGHGIAEVYSRISTDVVRKGNMVKFGNKVTAWKERWFVLTATALRYYSSNDEKDLKGTIALCSDCFTQSFPDKPGGKQHRFKIHTPNKHYEMAAPDLKSKNEWMADLKKVFMTIGKTKETLQQIAWKERKQEREERRRRTAEEELSRLAEREKLLERERQLEEERKQRQLAQEEIKERERLLDLERQKRKEEEEMRRRETNDLLDEKRREIEEEKQRFADTEARLKEEREALMKTNMEALEAEREQRALVEERLREEEAQLEEERRRLKELEEAKAHLEALVEEERALRRDEEIVRNLQSKILEEEFAKREELERLQAQQNQELMKEKMSRQEMEEARRKQEEAFRLAQEQLDALTRDRLQAEQKLEDAAEKLRQAENERQRMQERMKLKEMNSSNLMRRPLPQPDPDPFVTHRGKGAFTEADFHKEPRSPTSKDNSCKITSEGENCSPDLNPVTAGTKAMNLNGDATHGL